MGVQAAACAPLAGGQADGYTIAEGIAVKHPGELTSALVKDLLDEVVTVSDEEISQAIVLLLERVKLVVEGAGAAAIAALLAGRIGGTGPVTALLSGGNIDPTLLIQVMRHGLTLSGRYLVVRTRISDRTGELSKLLALFAEERANVVSVEHHREGMDIPVTETEVEATLLTRDEEHCEAILDAMSAWRIRRGPIAVMETCSECGHENAADAKFCSNCGAPLAVDAAISAREERKVVTVLFADLVGFTSRAEQMDPEDVRAVLEPYHAACALSSSATAGRSRSSSATR